MQRTKKLSVQLGTVDKGQQNYSWGRLQAVVTLCDKQYLNSNSDGRFIT